MPIVNNSWRHGQACEFHSSKRSRRNNLVGRVFAVLEITWCSWQIHQCSKFDRSKCLEPSMPNETIENWNWVQGKALCLTVVQMEIKNVKKKLSNFIPIVEICECGFDWCRNHACHIQSDTCHKAFTVCPPRKPIDRNKGISGKFHSLNNILTLIIELS